MGFRDFRKTAFLATTLDTDAFAEEVTYTPSGGAARTITAKITEGSERRGSAEAGYDRKLITVTLCTDEASAKGGVATISRDDRLTRSGARVYQWTGVKFEEFPHKRKVEFELVN